MNVLPSSVRIMSGTLRSLLVFCSFSSLIYAQKWSGLVNVTVVDTTLATMYDEGVIMRDDFESGPMNSLLW